MAVWKLLLATVIAVVGCSADEVPAEPTTGATLGSSVPSSGDAAAVAEQAAVAAYRGMWDAYVDAIGIPDPELPALSRFAADDALAVLVGGVEQVERDGLAGRGEVVLHPEVSELSPPDAPTTAEIVDCVDTSDTELYRRDGEPYNDTPGGWRRAEATAQEVDSSAWKVVGFALYEVGSCGG